MTAILPSHVLLLLNSLRGKVKPRVVSDVLTGLVSKGVFCMGGELESGVKADFPQLTTAPETFEYCCKSVINFVTFLSSRMKKVESSANAAFLRVPLGVSTPSTSALAAASKGSSAMMNSSGAIGSPCGTPCLHCRASSLLSTATAAFLL